MAMASRCTFRGCPVRYQDGDDRPCRGHSDQAAADTLGNRFALFADLASAPGFDLDGDTLTPQASDQPR